MATKILSSPWATIVLLMLFGCTVSASVTGLTTHADGSKEIIYFLGDQEVRGASIDTAQVFQGLAVQEATQWSDVVNLVREGGAKAVVVDASSMGQMVPEEANELLLNSTTFVGINTSGQMLAETLGLPALYTSTWGVQTQAASTTAENAAYVEDVYFIYSLDTEGVEENNVDLNQYLSLTTTDDPAKLEELAQIVETVSPPFSVRRKVTSDLLTPGPNTIPFAEAMDMHLSRKTNGEQDSTEIYLPYVGNQ